MKAFQRIGAHLAALILVPLVAYPLGTAYSVATDCHGNGSAAECDIPGVAGFAWAFFSVPLVVVAIALIEITLAIRRNTRTRSDRVTGTRPNRLDEPDGTKPD